MEEVENPGSQISAGGGQTHLRQVRAGRHREHPVEAWSSAASPPATASRSSSRACGEAEHGMIYDEFNSKQHEILTGTVSRIDPRTGNVSLRIGTGAEATEGVLSLNEQVPGEELYRGAAGQGVSGGGAPQHPRAAGADLPTHPGLVKRLFELEVPEIYDGTVEIRSIAREAGSRTKMAVWSADENVDPIGACVGPRGQRVAAIVEELRGEKIDIIKYSEDPAEFIAAALAPSDVVERAAGGRGQGLPGHRPRRPAEPWPSARRGRTPVWLPGSPGIRSTSSPCPGRMNKIVS